MLTAFTLKTCDTCKKALKWLDEQEIAYENHDVRKDGLSEPDVSAIVQAVGWEVALNRRSTTWRGLEDKDKEGVTPQKAVALILSNPTLLKRPVFRKGDQFVVGFDSKSQAAVAGLTA